MPADTLVILPAIPAKRLSASTFIITQKFVEGLVEYAKRWQGKLHVILEEGEHIYNNLDNIEIDLARPPFPMSLVKSYQDLKNHPDWLQNAVVLASAAHQQNHIAALCATLDVPCVYVTEYTLKTRWQIIFTEQANIVKKLRRAHWAWQQERRQQAAMRQASGVQCNGLPVYHAYKTLTPAPLLYFDTRVSQTLLATEDDVITRNRQRLAGKPLHLVFSGRLNPMKGADHLLAVASELQHLQVPFQMTICGDGPSKAAMEAQIRHDNLAEHVRLTGVLDFQTGLIPFVKQHADLFICCHRQGDPSCTYLETMSCGVPIIGYANEAWQGLAEYSKTGWVTPLDQPTIMAQKIAALAKNRTLIGEHALTALQFAQQHSMEKTFDRRIKHLQNLAKTASAN